MNGAETTAGSTFIRRSTIGMTDDTSALHNTIARIVSITTKPISGPTPSVQARIHAAIAIASATSVLVDNSLRSTVPRLRKLTSPTAMARTMVVVICVPLLPPVPMSSGIKKARAIAASNCSSKERKTVPVYASATNSTRSQTMRFFHNCQGDVCR